MEKYTIRRANKNDEATLFTLSRNVINQNFRAFMGDEAVDNFLESGMADAEITTGLGETSVLELEGKIIGLCIWKGNLLHLLMILPEYQGTGAAAFFINAMSEEKLREYSEINLECFEANKRANRFYRKCRWEEYKVESEEGFNRVFYCKKSNCSNEYADVQKSTK